MTEASVAVPAAEQLYGAAARAVTITLNKTYVNAGPAATDVFADIKGGLKLPLPAEKAGGVAAPNLEMTAVSAVQGAFPDVKAAVSGGLTQQDIVKRFFGGKLLEVIDLATLVKFSDDPGIFLRSGRGPATLQEWSSPGNRNCSSACRSRSKNWTHHNMPSSSMGRSLPPVPATIWCSTSSTPPRPRHPESTTSSPLFAWKRQGSVAEQGFTSEREAGGLRVYLNGPWFLSGEGELLGVAVVPIPETSVVRFGDTTVETNWARDPLWDTQSPFNLPSKGSFRNADKVVENIRLPEGNSQTVTMLGYPVSLDDSGCAFCDITVDPAGSYFPFIRLALTRFQPRSIRGMESSAVVLTDFVQLTPRRGVTVQRRGPCCFRSPSKASRISQPPILRCSGRRTGRAREYE